VRKNIDTTPLDINPEDYPEIRDKTDLPILVSAIVAGVDVSVKLL
jgi:hypothetical protein